ncbi:MAG: hypothetical protein KAX49_12465, partial [Halanaerobiales bacterium]|nr:hypothetical protein [Halanaerobiales bacterium]
MKKYIIFLTLLLLILVKIPVIAAETKVGFGGDWEIGSQLKVNMLTGVFVDEKKQYDYWVRGNLLYVPIDQNGIHGFLTLEKRGSFSDICLGYINPFNEKLDLEVGVNWTKKENKTTEKFIVNGNWNTTYGTVFLGGKLGLNGEEITLKYFRPYEKHLHNKLILKGNVGLQHLWEREGREISIPLRAKGI